MGYNLKFKGTKNSDVWIPDQIDGYAQTSVGSQAFMGENVTSTSFPDSLKTIGDGAYKDCKNLTLVTLNKVERIENWAFYGTGLTSITIPASVTYIGEGAFANTPLTSVTFEGDKSKITIADNAFPNTVNKDNITTVTTVTTTWDKKGFETSDPDEKNHVSLLRYVGDDTEVEIPSVITKTITKTTLENGIVKNKEEEVKKCYVTEIAKNCFLNRSDITKITFIPDSGTNKCYIYKIGDFAFRGCTSLKKVCYIKDSKENDGLPTPSISGTEDQNDFSIGNGAFHSCSSLESINIPTNVTKINKWTFAYCTNLKAVKYQSFSNLEEIGELAFYQCKSLTTLSYMGDTFKIDEVNYAKEDVVIIPKNVKNIATGTFYGCSSITDVIMPTCIYDTDNSTISSGIYSIEYNAFRDTTKLNSIKFYIAENMIDDKSNPYTKLTFSSNREIKLSKICAAAFHSSGIKQFGNQDNYIYIPKSYISNKELELGNYVFAHCQGIINVEIADGAISSIPYLTFYNCNRIVTVTMPSSINEIGKRAFMNCLNLESVIVPATQVTIGEEAFANCNKLNKIKQKDNISTENGTNITKVDKMAFYNCYSLEKMDFRNITNIGYQAFANSGLKTVNIISDSTITLQEGCFKNCSDLHTVIYSRKELTKENGLKKIPNYCFSGCSNLKTIGPNDGSTTGGWNISKSSSDIVTEIGRNAFDGCNNLNKIVISNKITSVGEEAFANCEGISQAEINCKEVSTGMFKNCVNLEILTFNGTENIRENSFENCISLDKVVLPASLKYIETNTFIGCSNLYNIILKTVDFETVHYIDFETKNADPTVDEDELLEEYGYEDAEDNISTIDYIFEFTDNVVVYMNTEDTKQAAKDKIIDNIGLVSYVEYEEDTTKKEITITNAKINDENVKLLSQIEGNEIHIIGENAFKNNTFSTIQLPVRITAVEKSAFYGCASLSNIEFTEYLTSIKDDAFTDCYSLEDITVSDKTTMTAYAFNNCYNLKEVNVLNTEATTPNLINNNGVIYNKDNELVIYPAKRDGNNYKIITGTTKIGKGAFRYTTGLSNVNIPDSVSIIEENAFVESGITNVNMPDSIKTVSNSAFKDCANLESIKLSNNSEFKTISENTFNGCEALTKVTIPSNVTTINKNAFANCANIEEIYLPKTVSSVDKTAFENDSNLTVYTTTYKKKDSQNKDIDSTCFKDGDAYLLKTNVNKDVLKVKAVVFDDKMEKITTTITAKNPRTSNNYGVGEEFIIETKTGEEIVDNGIIPEIDIFFGDGEKPVASKFNNGKAQFVEKIVNEDNTTSWIYRYVATTGDYGEINLKCDDSKTIVDLLGNSMNINNKTNHEFVTNSIVIDTVSPHVTISTKNAQTKENIVNNITNAEKIEYTFTFTEDVVDFNSNNITVNNGTKGKFAGSGKVYTLEVTPNVTSGNSGELQVIVEAGACKDVAGYPNIREESVITIDKIAPIFESFDAYGQSSIDISNIYKVKEVYKAGDKINFVATFSEGVKSNSVPSLVLRFTDNPDVERIVPVGTISGNKITYTYTIQDGDSGNLTVKGFDGKLSDNAGNEVIVTNKNLNSNSIIADTKAVTLDKIKVISPDFEYDTLLDNDKETKRFGKDKVITIVTEYSENVYSIASNKISNITNVPELKIKIGNSIKTATKKSVDGNAITYTYTISDGDNGEIVVASINGKVCDIAGNESTINKLPSSIEYFEKDENGEKIDKIVADTKKPEIAISLVEAIDKYDDDLKITGNDKYYRKGSLITFNIETNEYVYNRNNNELTKITKEIANSKLPTIIFGSTTAKGSILQDKTEVKYENNKTIITYTYKVADGDNGALNITVNADFYSDIALNNNNSKNSTINNVIADTVVPYIAENTDGKAEWKIEKTPVEQPTTMKVTGKFSEKLYVRSYNDETKEYNLKALTNASDAPKMGIFVNGVISKTLNASISTDTSGKTILTYSANIADLDGNISTNIIDGTLYDIAGNRWSLDVEADTESPKLQGIKVLTQEGSYKKADKVNIVVSFLEETKLSAVPDLTIKIGEDTKVLKGIIDLNDELNTEKIKVARYEYTVDKENGHLQIVSLIGTTSDGIRPRSIDETFIATQGKTLSTIQIKNIADTAFDNTVNSKIIIDTTAPRVTISVKDMDNTQDVINTNKDEVTYIFEWTEPVAGFEENDIELINALNEKFEKVSDKIYQLTVRTSGEGTQIVRVMDNKCEDIAGNSNAERVTFKKVNIDYTKPIIRATVNGGKFVIGSNGKSALKETIVANEELKNVSYYWTTSEDPNIDLTQIPWVSANVGNSDMQFNTEVTNKGTYYLYIKAEDLAGNILTTRTNGFEVVEGKIIFTPNTTESTNENVIVTIGYSDGLGYNRKAGVSGLTQSADDSKVIIYDNGTVYAEATDEIGNKVVGKLDITNIDRIAPTASISYTENKDESEKLVSVVAKIEFEEENVTIINNNGKDTYTFTDNGEFEFEFKDKAGNIGWEYAYVDAFTQEEEEEIDTIPPYIGFDYTVTSVALGNPIGATIFAYEDAKIAYSWDNKTWVTSEDYLRSVNVTNNVTKADTYTLYAKATDKAGNTCEVEQLTFKVVEPEKEVITEKAEIVFNGLTTVKIDGVNYVKVSPKITKENLVTYMDGTKLKGETPEFGNLTTDNKLKTTSEIKLDGEIKYIVVVLGDINCDGVSGDFIEDIIALNRYRISSKGLTTVQILAGDINNDNIIDFVDDIIQINRYRIGIIRTL